MAEGNLAFTTTALCAMDWWVAGVGGSQPEPPGLPSIRLVQLQLGLYDK